jgi:hypothetical protein
MLTLTHHNGRDLFELRGALGIIFLSAIPNLATAHLCGRMSIASITMPTALLLTEF